MSKGLLVGVALLSAVGINQSLAQTSNPAPPPATQAPTVNPAPAADTARSGPTDNQIGDEVDARIAKLKADLRLTADQDGNWAGLQTGLHDYGVNQIKSHLNYRNSREDRREERRDAKDRDEARGKNDTVQPTAIAQMRSEADELSARAADLKKLADAAEPIYRSLDDSQRRVLVRFMRTGFERGMR